MPSLVSNLAPKIALPFFWHQQMTTGGLRFGKKNMPNYAMIIARQMAMGWTCSNMVYNFVIERWSKLVLDAMFLKTDSLSR